MLSYEDIYNRVATLVTDTSADTEVLVKNLVNETLKYIWGQADYSFKEKTRTIATSASTRSYELPADVERVKVVYYQVGDTLYVPEEISDERTWATLTRWTTQTNDFPRYFFIRGDNVEFEYPFATASLTITVVYNRRIKDLSADNYSTGTITTLANGGTAVTGSGSTWTATMVGRYFKVNSDGIWYEISAFTDTTHITLAKPYLGTAIAAGTEAYTIAEVPPIPEEFQDILWMRPTAIYYQIKNEENRSQFYITEYTRMMEQMKRKYRSKTAYGMLAKAPMTRFFAEHRSPNDYPVDITG